jgi:lysine/ornithine N-monooxygenase
MVIHDLIGVGFGPSNIALAIALDEKRHDAKRVDALFIEKPGQLRLASSTCCWTKRTCRSRS